MVVVVLVWKDADGERVADGGDTHNGECHPMVEPRSLDIPTVPDKSIRSYRTGNYIPSAPSNRNETTTRATAKESMTQSNQATSRGYNFWIKCRGLVA